MSINHKPVQGHFEIYWQGFRQGDAFNFLRRSFAEDSEVGLAHAPHHNGHALPLRSELELPDDADLFLER